MDDASPQSRITIQAGADEQGIRLDKLLASVPEIGSRAAAQRLIAAGRVLVDGVAGSKKHRVRPGEEIEAVMEPPEELSLQPEDLGLSIPYEDRWLLVVDKPAGVVTHPGRGHDHGTLVHGLLAHQVAGGESPHRPGIVHRLDKDTSGLLVVARDDATHRLLVEMLRRHQIERTYIALVHGYFETREGTIDAPVGRDAANRQRMSVAGTAGRAAVTHFRVIRSWAGDGSGRGRRKEPGAGLSLLEVRLDTGRTHQIRVHLEAIGHPVAGDTTYSRRRDRLGIGRQFLHATRLTFSHPQTGETIEVQSPLPDDLQSVLDRLEQGSG
ncbi:ribosomal large subunit pseudouridine synthase D [bacterium BMS3Abin01]|nr:ribosomal large subunit pseudouridine synthase D [bacterium BMS3Abin01]HDY70002.1 RluA family pseudouridine synthase [Actinomycetota bacterium]